MKAQHTPGPWTISTSGHDIHDILGGPYVIAAVYGTRGYARKESEANARLIAAAPDTFDACVQLVAEFDRMNASRPDPDKLGDTPGLAAARAAIAKATGADQ